ncbi:MAG TPA: hypothetical protein VHT91_37530 [Kofleriaceae bacterium]|jgi:hypothetical protein|nr:hypothetical protein [Kofleriaceae bacterium]
MRINSFLGVLTLNLGLSLVTACTDPIEPTTATRESAVTTCYNFSSFAGTFGVGDAVMAADATVNFQQFQWSSGIWTAGGIASVVTSTWAGGTPVNELNLNNILMRVTPNTPSAGVNYRYADLGGNVNFGVNGDFRNVLDLDTLDGTVVGGCDIMVTRTNFPGGYRGIVEIMPQPGVMVDRFSVGGQEFFVDDVCQ